MKILVFNAGSSSYKLSLFDMEKEDSSHSLWEGRLEWGREKGVFCASTGLLQLEFDCKEKGLETLLENLLAVGMGSQQAAIACVAHRFVHGGSLPPVIAITPEIEEELQKLIALAPLHQPQHLEGLALMQRHFPSLLQIAVFDTAFHQTMPEKVKTYPIPLHLRELGVLRYGFHGISHRYCAERVLALTKTGCQGARIINCHLGNGCSLCAIEGGKSVDTTMGFTPLEGIMMGTRSGSIDPGILLYLLREKTYSLEEIDFILNRASGLKAIAGISDMRDLIAKKATPQAALAIEMFLHRLKQGIGAMAAAMGDFDYLSFTAGIGENSPLIRERVCSELTCFGLTLDHTSNWRGHLDREISDANAKRRVFVLRTKEEWMIAKIAQEII